MSETPAQCAHMHVSPIKEYERPGVVIAERWQCRDCLMQFVRGYEFANLALKAEGLQDENALLAKKAALCDEYASDMIQLRDALILGDQTVMPTVEIEKLRAKADLCDWAESIIKLNWNPTLDKPIGALPNEIAAWLTRWQTLTEKEETP